LKICYAIGNKLYLNITNACPCDCKFCIRKANKSVGDADTLWLSRQPVFQDVKQDLSARNLSAYNEIVFCGFGEPTCALSLMLDTCRFLKMSNAPPLRLNTNGLSDLINSKHTPPLFEGLLDAVSISLNAPTSEEYTEITRPKYGESAFDAMLRFAADCKLYIPSVAFSVVDIIGKEKIAQCGQIADSLGVSLTVRGCV